MSSKRRRSARPDPARRRLGSNLEVLESRQLLAQSPYLPDQFYPLTRLPAGQAIPARSPGRQIAHPIGTNPAILATYQNEGKVLTGQDRQGNRWELKLTGSGRDHRHRHHAQRWRARRQHQHDHPGRHQPDQVGPDRHGRAVGPAADRLHPAGDPRARSTSTGW